MTDKERLLALLNDFGVTPSETADVFPEGDEELVTLEAGNGDVEGWPHFYCLFAFGSDGSFKTVGVWE